MKRIVAQGRTKKATNKREKKQQSNKKEEDMKAVRPEEQTNEERIASPRQKTPLTRKYCKLTKV